MDIKIFSTPTCPYCHQAKEYLSGKGVPYTDIDVSSDDAARKEMVEVSGQMGVPVLVIDTQVVVGFDKNRIDSLLETSHGK
ncbi:MAG: glutathione S-transferase N-terminal domain-containing protein [Candidatus Omnitrophica bacterium]|nr:glutathione S-transferase N-terminal domain-containing protein [Candidatus Omnitrophota bacterium]